MVAKKMPAIAMRMVLTMPTQRARPPVAGLVSMPSLSWMSGGRFRKSKPVLMFRARRLSPAWLARNHMVLSTTIRRDTWAIHFRMMTSRHSGVRADAAMRGLEEVEVSVMCFRSACHAEGPAAGGASHPRQRDHRMSADQLIQDRLLVSSATGS